MASMLYIVYIHVNMYIGLCICIDGLYPYVMRGVPTNIWDGDVNTVRGQNQGIMPLKGFQG